MSATVIEELAIWETSVEQTRILVRDPVTKRIVAEVPGTDAQAQAEARQIAVSGFLMAAMKNLIAWVENNGELSGQDVETPLHKARLAMMIATGRSD